MGALEVAFRKGLGTTGATVSFITNRIVEKSGMQTLTEMTQPEFGALLAAPLPRSAAVHVRSGNWGEPESLENAL